MSSNNDLQEVARDVLGDDSVATTEQQPRTSNRVSTRRSDSVEDHMTEETLGIDSRDCAPF